MFLDSELWPDGFKLWTDAKQCVDSIHFADRVVPLDEDFTIGEGIQQGLATGANQHFTFGRYECGLHLGQRSIDAALAGELRL